MENICRLRRAAHSPNAASASPENLQDQWIIVIAPRLSSHVGFPPIGESWKDTMVDLPETLPLAHAHDLFTCCPLPVEGGRVKLADALSILPFAVITNL